MALMSQWYALYSLCTVCAEREQKKHLGGDKMKHLNDIDAWTWILAIATLVSVITLLR